MGYIWHQYDRSECHMNFMWYSSSNAPYHFCHIDAICNPYKYTRYIKSTWASYVNATRVGVNNLHKVVMQRCLEQDLNLRPTDRKPKCLTVTPPRHGKRTANKGGR